MPDKVYIREYPDTIAHYWEEKKKDDVIATIIHEYINKDVLIEWLKKNLQELNDEEGIPFEYYENGIITGKISAFEQVINKLNSM